MQSLNPTQPTHPTHPTHPAYSTPPQGGLSAAELKARWAAEQVHLQCGETLKIPLPIFLVGLLMGFGVWDLIPRPIVLTWFFSLTGLQAARAFFAKRHLNGHINAQTAEKALDIFGLLNGVVTAGGFFLFSKYYTLQWMSLATTLLSAMVAGSIPATALNFKRFLLYSLPVSTALALGWAINGKVEPPVFDYIMGMLCLMFFGVCLSFAKDSETSARQTYAMRFENEHLLHVLQKEQKEVARQRDTAQRANRGKSRFLAAASHDLRQPLQTISMYNAALGLKIHEHEASELIKRESVAIKSLTSMLNALLDVSQLDLASIKIKKQPTSLAQLFSRFDGDFRSLAAGRGIHYEVSCPDNLSADTDPVLLERILRNVLDNAFKHGGKTLVSITARSKNTNEINIEISDDGPGIPAAEAEAVFEEFYQLQNEERDRSRGLGLGLAIVKRMSELLNAQCKLESKDGLTLFTLTLARSTDIAAPTYAQTDIITSSSLHLKGYRVLLIDDDFEVRQSVSALLSEVGCMVDSTGELDDATHLLAQHSYLAVLVDYRLKGSSNGLQFILANRQAIDEAATIIISGDASPELQERSEHAGVPMLRKPIDAKVLIRTLEDITLL